MSLALPPLLFSWSGHTHTGRVRKNNEDSFLGLSIDNEEVRYLGKTGEASLSLADYVFAVSDGMGGAMAGEFASRIAVEKITKIFPSYLTRITRSKNQNTLDEIFFHEALLELFHEIHRALLFLGACYEECRGMGTTLTLCWVRAERIYFAHIGDSRMYHLPHQGGITQISEDDTHVGWLFRQGKITEREAKYHPRRTSLQKALGAEHQFVTPQVGTIQYHSKDRFLLCTDGVTDGLFDCQLLDILSTPTPKTASQHLVEEAIARSGRDNTTAMILQM